MQNNIFFPPEWYAQSAVQMTWPHAESDWGYMLDEITSCCFEIARHILKYQKLIIVCKDKASVKILFEELPELLDNLILVELLSNDTWARDHAGISVFIDNNPYLYDFSFNGWGLKFPANFDNQLNKSIYASNVFQQDVVLVNKKQFVLEGGSIESDGKGTLLTTSECLLSPNRNSFLSKSEIEKYLIGEFGLSRVLWLDSGYLSGDDTDSHVDTLARFCDEYTIAYVKCEDQDDEHYADLLRMEQQLKEFVNFEGNPYKLVELPMADPVCFDGERLPATYANFLILNDAVLVPTYNSNKDTIALEQLKKAFPTRQVIGIDCTAVIKQHGSLHCLTMQYPKGFLR